MKNEIIKYGNDNYNDNKINELFDIEKQMLIEIKTLLKDKKLKTKEKIAIIREARTLLKENSFIIKPKQEDNANDYVDYIDNLSNEELPNFENDEIGDGDIETK